MQLIRQLFIAASLLALLSGCETTVPVKEVEPPPPAIAAEELSQAEALEQAGNYLAAADYFEKLAQQAPEPLQNGLLLRAAENRLLSDTPESAEQVLEEIDPNALSPIQELQRRQLLATLALLDQRFQKTLELLSPSPPEDTPLEQLQRYHRTKAEAFQLTGNALEGARELAKLDPLLDIPSTRLNNQQAILQTLTTLTDAALAVLVPGPEDALHGWVELARIIKAYAGELSVTRIKLDSWKTQFPSHPVLAELLAGYLQRLQEQYKTPTHLALLLPFSGPFADAAGAVKDGFLAAYYDTPLNKRPQLRFYDSSNPTDIWPLYRRAIDEGADMVIGPLNKESVSQLARAGELEVPVLALNQVVLQSAPPANLYQFGLSPEDEAQQVAEQAWLEGHRSALVFTPQGSWGDRIYESFRDRWESLGNSVLEQQTYNPKEQDLSGPLRTLLNLDESDARHRKLRGILKTRFKFQPRRRQDVDFVFFAANPVTARQIRPLLQFHHAGNLPVFATSRAYSGTPDPVEDRDLEGLKFPEIPWLLATESLDPLSKSALSATLATDLSRYARLYAMGIDGYTLLPHLIRLQSSPWETLDGHTGNLYLDQSNRVHRRLVWVEMDKGLPKILGYAPRIDSGTSNPLYELPPLPEVMPLPDTPPPAEPQASIKP